MDLIKIGFSVEIFPDYGRKLVLSSWDWFDVDFWFSRMISFLDDFISGKRKRQIWKNAKHQGRSVCSVRAERVSDDATYLVKFICIKSAAEILTLNFFRPKSEIHSKPRVLKCLMVTYALDSTF